MDESFFSLSVGRPYSGECRAWPETAQVSWNRGRYELLVSFASPTPAEVQSIRQERVRLAACRYRSVLLWGWQFGSLPWGDCPYSWHLQQQADPGLSPPIPERVARPLLVILLDARDGIVQALRLLTLPAFFVESWERALVAQSQSPWDERQYDAELQVLYGMYPTERLVRELNFVRCILCHRPEHANGLSITRI